MKKLFVTALVLTALLAVTVGTAFAGSALELYKVQNNSGGVTFTFRVNGEFSADELASGFVQVQGGDDYPLYCAQTAPDTVVCHSSKKASGHDVVVGFGGARFWTDVPEPTSRSVCYPAYDFVGPNTPPGITGWSHFGNVCQDEAAFEAQEVLLFNPEYSFSYWYEFWGNGVNDFGYANPGEGYFFYFH